MLTVIHENKPYKVLLIIANNCCGDDKLDTFLERYNHNINFFLVHIQEGLKALIDLNEHLLEDYECPQLIINNG